MWLVYDYMNIIFPSISNLVSFLETCSSHMKYGEYPIDLWVDEL